MRVVRSVETATFACSLDATLVDKTSITKETLTKTKDDHWIGAVPNVSWSAMNEATQAKNRDPRWQRIFDNVPSDFLLSLVRSNPKHKLENLTKGHEVMVDEIFRICTSTTIDLLCEQFPGLEGMVWFFKPEAQLSKKQVNDAAAKVMTPALRDGTQPQLGREPRLYKAKQGQHSIDFEFAAKDAVQHLRTGFDQRMDVEVINFYRAIIHFSEPRLIVFGPYTGERANAVAVELSKILKLDAEVTYLKAKRGEGKGFYRTLKTALGANLIETKRHDPSGDYETVALEARHQQPDLEKVPSFQKRYLQADSVYDVLQFDCDNPVGIKETSHVKFGRPFGRFNFRARTSLAAIRHFEETLYDVLR